MTEEKLGGQYIGEKYTGNNVPEDVSEVLIYYALKVSESQSNLQRNRATS
jgi:hypothetical protein